MERDLVNRLQASVSRTFSISRRSRLTLVAILVLAVEPVTSWAQSTSDNFLRGRTALEEERYQESDSLLSLVGETNTMYGAALALRARIAFDRGDRKAGTDLLKLSKDIDPGNRFAVEADLWERWKFPPKVLPLLQDIRLRRRAHRALESDSTIAMAHAILGAISTEEYLNIRSAVSIPALENTAASIRQEAELNAALLLTPTLKTSDSEQSVQYEYRGYGRHDEVESLKKPGAEKKFDNAYSRLASALTVDPLSMKAYRITAKLLLVAEEEELLHELSSQMTNSLPGSPYAWLLSGYASYLHGMIEESEENYAHGLALLPESERELFNDVTRLFGRDDEDEYGEDGAEEYWKGRDPRYMTSANERRLEHYNRMVYAEFRFGDMFKRKRGWDTEPGKVVVRYGIPLAEAQTSTMLDKYLAFVYEDFSFKFMDLSKAGKYTFYSPPAGSGGPSFEEIRIAQQDQTLVAKEMFDEKPTRYVYNAQGRRMPFPFRVSTFRSNNQDSVDVVVTAGLDLLSPEFQSASYPVTLRSGLFLVDDNEVIDRSAVTSRISIRRQRTFEGEYQLATTVQSVTGPTGEASISVEFDAGPGNPVGFERREVLLPRYGPAEPMSDLVVAYGIEDADEEDAPNNSFFTRKGVTVQPAPWGVFGVGQPIYLYFELYAEAGSTTDFEIEARLVRKNRRTTARRLAQIFRSRRTGVSTGFTLPVNAPAQPVDLILDTKDQKPGEFVLAVQVKNAKTGETSVRSRDVLLQATK